MHIPTETLEPLRTAISYGLISCILSFLLAPFLIKILYKYKLTRHPEYDATLAMGVSANESYVFGLEITTPTSSEYTEQYSAPVSVLATWEG